MRGEPGRAHGVSARASVGFGAVLLIMAALVVVSLAALWRSSGKQQAVMSAYASDLLAAARLELAAEEMVAVARGYLLSGDSSHRMRADALESRFGRELERLLARSTSEDGLSRLLEVQRAAARYRDTLDVLMEQTPTPLALDQEVARALVALFQHRADLKARLDEYASHKEARLAQGRALVLRERNRATCFILILGAAGLVAGAGLAFVTTRRLARQYAEAHAAAARAEQAAAAREQVLAIVAHDLRSPLSAITTGAGLIRRAPDRGPSNVRRARRIEETAARMESLIQNLLDAAAIDAGGLAVRPATCAVDEIVAGAVDLFSTLADQKSIRLERTVPAGLTIWADKDRLQQVLWNLLANALRFTPEGGTVTVEASLIQDRVRIAVRDTGPGIGADDQERVFQRHWRADPGGRRGAGLGLFIARAIAEAHGGQLWVESSPGRGSTFVCDMPASEAVPAGGEPA